MSATSSKWIETRAEAPLRVDFAGGWLDVPRFALPGAYIVNCAISPTVTLDHWPYQREAGLGGSGAWALLNGRHGVESELNLGVGWQDPAVITETGLCVWHSGPVPRLEIKTDGHWLAGRMVLFWTGRQHNTPEIANAGQHRDFQLIAAASHVARSAVWHHDIVALRFAMELSYRAQQGEGMPKLSFLMEQIVGKSDYAFKYCGGGFGGYALYLFQEPWQRNAVCASHDGFLPIEPYVYARS